MTASSPFLGASCARLDYVKRPFQPSQAVPERTVDDDRPHAGRRSRADASRPEPT